MKVYIGPYKNWIGPYQIAEKILFWKDKNKDEIVDKFGKWLNGTWVRYVCEYLHSKKEHTVKVRIDNYDTWSMDSTLAYIILPMLKQLQESKCGSPWVDDEDVPEEIRSINASPKTHEDDWDDNIHKRWEYVLNEMIFAFESKHNDWEDEFFAKDDFEGMRKVEERIQNGFRLFGKYYQALWD